MIIWQFALLFYLFIFKYKESLSSSMNADLADDDEGGKRSTKWALEYK